MTFTMFLRLLTVLVKKRFLRIGELHSIWRGKAMKKFLIFFGVLLGLPSAFATKPADYINRVIDEITAMLTETVFKGALLVIVIAAIYYLLGIDPEKRDMARKAFWYALLAIIIVKTAPTLISWLKNL